MDFGKIWYAIHGDKKFKALSDAAQMLFIYLFSCKATEETGIGWLPVSYMVDDRNRPEEQILAALIELERAEMVSRDDDWIMVNNYLKHHPPSNPKHHMRLIRQADKIQKREWRDLLLKKLSYEGSTIPYMVSGMVSDTLPVSVADTLRDTSRSKFLVLSSLSSSHTGKDHLENARAKQIDINGVLPAKKAAKEVRRKAKPEAPPDAKPETKPDEPDYIDQLIAECSRIRFSYRHSILRTNGKVRGQMSEVLEFCKAQWKEIQAAHGWPDASSGGMLRWISLFYEAFMLEDEGAGPDTDFARGCNFAFGTFLGRIQKYAEIVANAKDSYGNPVFVPLDEPEDVLRYETGCSHESLMRVQAFKQRRLKDSKLISRYVSASGPPHEKRWREERERIARGEPRSVSEDNGNGKK